MTGRTILFIEAGYRRSYPALIHARDLGYRVLVIGSALPDADKHLADEVVVADTFNIDECLLLLRRRPDIADIVAVFTMVERVLLLAHVAQELGLIGISVAAATLAQDKYACRAVLAAQGLPQPRFRRISKQDELTQSAIEVGFPAILKPVGGAASKGVLLVNSMDELHAGYAGLAHDASALSDHIFGYFHDSFILEEYVPGSEYSVEGWVQEGKVSIVAITEKWTDHDNVEIKHLVPARIARPQEDAIIACVRDIARVAGLDNCAFHIELRWSNGGPVLIEVNARPGGGCITTHLVPAATGVDFVAAAISIACGRTAGCVDRPTYRQHSVVEFLMTEEQGKVAEWQGLDAAEQIPGVVAIVVEKTIGHEVYPWRVRSGHARLACVVTAGSSADQVLALSHTVVAGLGVIVHAVALGQGRGDESGGD